MLTRQQFADYMNSVHDGLGNVDSPLWIPEWDIIEECQWFIKVNPIKIPCGTLSYWNWICDHLKGEVRCYTSDSDNQEEWWGFTHKEDIVWWSLRWQ
jgi:hypothetical protein